MHVRPALVLAVACALALPMLAGCFDSFRPDAHRVVCPGGECNLKATVEPATRQANELSIAVNPTDPDNILATGKDYTPEYAGDCVWDGLYVTHDGGRTWTNSNLPGSNWKRLSGDLDEPVNEFSRYWCATDPVVAFGPDGTAYWSVMPYQCDRLSGSKTGRDVAPSGGFNDWLWTCSSMYVLVSEDGGDTWPIVREVAFGPRLEHDKQWISVAPNGMVLLCWDRDPTYQLVGLVPASNAAQQLTPTGAITCATSSDRGRTWTDGVDANTGWDGFLPWVDWDGENRAWMAALDGEDVLVTHSMDGLSWAKPVVVGHYVNPPPGGEYGWPVVNGSDFRIFALPTLAVDRSGGPHSGNVYVAWFDHSTGDGEVVLTVSRDRGATWSAPTRVHDDDPALRFDQFMPSVAVGPDGTLDVTWYDRRDDPDNHLFNLYHTYSTDGGRTFGKNLRVSAVSIDEQYSHHQNGMVFMGDYLDLDSSRGRAHAVWVDTRDHKADVYVATIARPSANG